MLVERTVAGLHAYIVSEVLPGLPVPVGRAVDLGAGSGALAVRLAQMGFDVTAVELDAEEFRADTPFVCADLLDEQLPLRLGKHGFALVTAVEVIEHLENPIAFLRTIGRLLAPDGIAVVTTPNLENAPARAKFLLTGKLRAMDELGDPTHIAPVFMNLLEQKYLPRADLELFWRQAYPPKGYLLTRPRYRWAFHLLANVLQGDSLYGDTHIWCLQRADGRRPSGPATVPRPVLAKQP